MVGVTTGSSVAGGSVFGGVVSGGLVAGGSVGFGSVAGGVVVTGVLSVVGFVASVEPDPAVSGAEAPVELSSVDDVVVVLSGTEEFSSSDVVKSDVDDVVGFTVEVLSEGLFD